MTPYLRWKKKAGTIRIGNLDVVLKKVFRNPGLLGKYGEPKC
jgi:hypothetical protein